MKSGVPWSIRIDEDARETARVAARQSGKSVAEWLNEVIAERAAEEGIAPPRQEPAPDDEDAGAVAEAVEKLTRRIRSMDETSRSALSGLEDRLDEIERHLGALPRLAPGTGERARSLRGVSAMVSDLSRDLDDVDERARRRIEGLRERMGRAGAAVARDPSLDTVTDAIRKLDRRIAAASERVARPSADTELDEVRKRLDALLAQAKPPASPAPPPVRPPAAASLDATLQSLESRIEEAKARLARRASATPDIEDRARRIEARLADLNRQFVAADEPPPAPPPPAAGGDLMAAIEEISARQRALDAAAEERAEARRKSVEDAALSAVRRDIAGLADKIIAFGRGGAEDQGAFYDLTRRIDALAADRPFEHKLLSGIQDDLATLKAAVAGTTGIAERLEFLVDRSPDRGRLDVLSDEVAGIRRALEAADSPRAIQRLEMRLAELGRGVEGALAASQAAVRRADNDGISRLEARLDDIAARIDNVGRNDQAETVAAIHERLAALADRIDDIGTRRETPDTAFDDIKSEIAAVRQEIARREPPRTDHLESQIADLAAKLDRATDTAADASALAELEAQVASLASELERTAPRTDTLRQVEENLTHLQHLLSDSRRDSIEAARVAARETLSEMAGARGGDSDLLRALKSDLETIRAAASSTDRRTEETLTSLHDTLATVVDRLSRLESDGEPARATGTFGAPPPPPRSDVSTAAMRAHGRLGEAFDDNRPLEPGSGKPDLAALRELTRTSADGGRTARPADRKADFIAAARRAAQAAAAETAAAVAAEPEVPEAGSAPAEGGQKASAFARIGQAIRNRRRPLLLAAAAIVLAIGALQLFGDRLTTPGSASAARPKAAVAISAAPEPPRTAAADPTAFASASATGPKVSEPALVPPPKGGASLAFAAPEDFDSRFGDTPTAPAAGAFATDDDGAAPVADSGAGTQTASLDAGVPPSANPADVAPKPDPGIGGPRLLDAAASGDPTAAFEVAVRYAEGRGVPADLSKAADWYRRAAEGGVAVAQYRLGSLYERGQGVSKDLNAAVDWYQRAADQGNVGAMHNLAVLMSEGVDGSPNPEKALQWFLAAANYGVKDSQYNLGVIYARAIGTPQDLSESYKWFAVAAASGDKDAAGRRDDVAKLLSPDDLAKARAAVTAWHAKPTLPEANAVAAPDGGWDTPAASVSDSDRRNLVMKIQSLLAAQGYDPGPADGVEGPKTRDAVKAFQRNYGIAETGSIDRNLMTALASQG